MQKMRCGGNLSSVIPRASVPGKAGGGYFFWRIAELTNACGCGILSGVKEGNNNQELIV